MNTSKYLSPFFLLLTPFYDLRRVILFEDGFHSFNSYLQRRGPSFAYSFSIVRPFFSASLPSASHQCPRRCLLAFLTWLKRRALTLFNACLLRIMASVTLNAAHHLMLPGPNDFTMFSSSSSSPPPPWTPNSDTLQNVVSLLSYSTTDSSQMQAQLYEQLQRLSAAPDFCNYLAYILSVQDESKVSSVNSDAIRHSACLILKSTVRVAFNSLHASVRQYVSSALVQAMFDRSLSVRPAVASCISQIATTSQDLSACHPLLPALQHTLKEDASPTPIAREAALYMLSCLAEDVPHLLEQHPSRPLDILVPACIRLCGQQLNPVRAQTLQILNHFALGMPLALAQNVDAYVNTLFAIADDSSAQVRKRICTALCLLLDSAPHALTPHMNNAIEYMLLSSTHPDGLVAREALEFWSLFAHAAVMPNVLRPYLPRLIPVLLRNMTYSPEEVELIDASESTDDMMGDRSDDMRPRFHQPRFKDTLSLGDPNGHGPSAGTANGIGFSEGGSSDSTMVNGHKLPDKHEDSDEDSDEEDESFVDMGEESEWRVRKSSAYALDLLSCVLKEDVLEIVLPLLQEKLSNANRWEERECGVLAVGAIAEGCYHGITIHMRSIFPFLLHCATDEHRMVRSIAFWTLSRYCKWVISERDDALFQQLLKVLLDGMHDRNEVVQKASCSALAVFEEESGSFISSYLNPILSSLTAAFERYQRSNMPILYDVVNTLADAVGSELANPEYVSAITPPLFSKWNTTADDDSHMLPLVECLASVVRALGSRSEQFAVNIVTRCCSVIDNIYSNEGNGQIDSIHVDFITCCLDLSCALAEALGSTIDPYAATSGPKSATSSNPTGAQSSTTASPPLIGSKSLLSILLTCMRDPRQEIRQSAFALLGEFARSRLPSMIAALPEYFKCTVEALDPQYSSVSNNATWALAELTIMAGFLPPNVPVNRVGIQHILLNGAIDQLIQTVNASQLKRSLLENSALTLGRIGLILSEELAPKLPSFAEAVFSALRNIRDDVEKEQAFHGMNAMIMRNPSAVFNCFAYYVDAVASWFHCKPELEMEFARIFGSYKSVLGDQWFSLFNSLPPLSQNLLKERFNV